MKLFRRRSSWPNELERRKPENAQFRAELELAHKHRAQLQAAAAIALTNENQDRINLLESAVRALARRSR